MKSGTTKMNGQQVPLPQQQQPKPVPIVSIPVASGRPITIVDASGKPIEVTSGGGRFYGIEGLPDVYFRSPDAASQYAASRGQQGAIVGQSYTRSSTGELIPVSSEQYWAQKTAKEETAKSAYGGVRTATALGEVGKPVSGSQLEAKVKFLERGTGQFASEAQFTKTAEDIGKVTPISAKGVIVTPGFRTGEEQLKAMEPTITLPETQKLTLPPTPRETTEAFMKRVSIGGGLVEPQIFKVREGSIVSQYFYTPGAEFKDVFGGRTPIKPGMFYTRDIFGFTTERPISEVPAMKQVTQREAEIIKTTETIAGTGLGMGFGEAFTTSSMLRGAKLIQPGDVAAITKSIKSLAPKMPSGLKEFIGAEEAVLPRARTVQVSQSVSKQYTPTSQIEAVGVVGGKLITREVRGTVVEISEPEIETSAIVSGDIAHAQAQYVKAMEKGRIELARLQQVYGAVEVPKTVQVTQQAQRMVSATRQVSLQQQLQKSLLLPVSIYKLFSIQQPEAITKQITKQRTILTPVEIGMTRQISPQITKQIQRQYQIAPQITTGRTATPTIMTPTTITPTTTTPTFTPPEIPKTEPPRIPEIFEPPRPPRTPEIPREPRPPREPPIKIPVLYPDFQIYPTRKKKTKKRRGERILKLYPIGQAENILASLGMGTKKKSKRKHKK